MDSFRMVGDRDARMYSIGVIVSAQRLLEIGAREKARDVLSSCGLDVVTLKGCANHLDRVQDDVLLDVIEEATSGGALTGFVDGKKVTHAHGTGGGWALYHYGGEEEHPPADEMEPLHGWPNNWPPWVHSEWLARAGVEVV